VQLSEGAKQTSESVKQSNEGDGAVAEGREGALQGGDNARFKSLVEPEEEDWRRRSNTGKEFSCGPDSAWFATLGIVVTYRTITTRASPWKQRQGRRHPSARQAGMADLRSRS